MGGRFAPDKPILEPKGPWPGIHSSAGELTLIAAVDSTYQHMDLLTDNTPVLLGSRNY